jgi:hypothetical protein
MGEFQKIVIILINENRPTISNDKSLALMIKKCKELWKDCPTLFAKWTKQVIYVIKNIENGVTWAIDNLFITK